MSLEPAAPVAQPDPSWPVLSLHERRILGVLVEKAKTTPDTYPLSQNALLTGCNQKSNRDPVLTLSDLDVEEALLSAQKKGLAIKITGGRVERWRHALYEAWRVDKVDLAVLAELLLRGPQTEGELRTRASRMEPIDDLEALRAELRPLAERRLVVYLSPEGRRGTVLTHGFHSPEELERLKALHGREPVATADFGAASDRASGPARMPLTEPRPVADSGLAALETQLAGLREEIDSLRHTVEMLQSALGRLTDEVRFLQEAITKPASSPVPGG